MRVLRRNGQMIVLFALALVPLLGFVGLAIDGGNAVSQRRLVQNAADSAALAGARDLAAGDLASISTHVNTYTTLNAGSTAQASWSLIDNAGNNVGSNGVGVGVTVTNTFPTFFLQALGVETATVSAIARAQVQALTGFYGEPPFLVCNEALQVTPNMVRFPGGILDMTTNPPSINPLAIGVEFWVHHPQLGQNRGGCGWTSGSSFKGNADDGQVGCPSTPCYMDWQPGTRAGPTRNRVAGYPGCSSSNNLDDCVLILPIVINQGSSTCTGSQPSRPMCVVAWAAFEVQQSSANRHIGKLLGQVLSYEGTGTDWTPGSTGPVVVRLSL